jgi:uncharacterized membrane protein YphA (DoxX/SURF4 family)
MTTQVLRGARIALAALLLAAGLAKLAGANLMVQQFDVVGLGQAFRYLFGLLEIVAAFCLLSTRLAVYGAVLVSALTVGAVGATIGHAARVVLQSPPSQVPQITVTRTHRVQLDVRPEIFRRPIVG